MKNSIAWKLIFASVLLGSSLSVSSSFAKSKTKSKKAEPAVASPEVAESLADAKPAADTSVTTPAAAPTPVPIESNVVAPGQAPTGKVLSLDDSVAMAVKSATLVLKTQRDRELGGTLVLQSYLQFMPNLTAQGSYNSTHGKTFLTTAAPTLVDGSSFGTNYTISTTLNLFNGFSDIASWSAAHDRRDAAEKTVIRAKQQIFLDISQSYLQVVLDQRLVQIAEKNLKASHDRETLLDEQTKVGIRNKSDLFRQQAQTSLDEAYMLSTQSKSQNDMILLLRKLRISPDEKYQLLEPPLEDQVQKMEKDISKQTVDEMVHQALEYRKDYDVARLNAEASGHDVTSARANYLPRLDFVASYLTSGRSFDYQNINGINTAPLTQPSMSDQLRDQSSYYYGIVLTWNIFDRWSNASNVERAKATAYKAQIDSEDFRNQVVGEVKQALSDYQIAQQQLETSQKGLIAARKAYEVTEGRYEVGSLNFVDLSTAQSTLVQAEANRAQALIGYELQKRALDYALGTIAAE